MQEKFVGPIMTVTTDNTLVMPAAVRRAGKIPIGCISIVLFIEMNN